MKIKSILCLLLSFFLVLVPRSVRAVDAELENAEAPAGNGTLITSDELNDDQNSGISVFTGNVIVVGTNFRMRCQEMTVTFNKLHKVQNVLARGDVLILQPNRVTHAGQAEFMQDEDKIVLTDQPHILDGKNTIEAPKIIIFRSKNTLITEGRSKTFLAGGIEPTPATTNSTPVPPPAPSN